LKASIVFLLIIVIGAAFWLRVGRRK